MTGVFTERGHLNTDTQREDSHVMIEAEVGGLHLQAKRCQGLTALPEAERKAWNRFYPRAFGGAHSPADTFLHLTSGL